MVQHISNQQFKDLMSKPESIVLDVRTAGEVMAGVIPNATHMDIMDHTFGQKLKDLDPEKEYLVYCRSGGRSAMACELMIRNGLNKVYNLANGIMGWDGEVVEFSM